jgi:DNA-binding NarL/FixJ family response regulator
MIRVLVLTDQPILARGFQDILSGGGMEVASVSEPAGDVFQPANQELVLLDLTGEFTFETLAETHRRMPGCNLVIRVGPMSRELIFQALEYGVRGILPVRLSPDMLIQSLHRIAKGELVIEVTDSGFDPAGERRISFSEREKQVVELLAQGLKNKEIAAAMNLAEGTVKVYLSRLFKKTKVRDRFELMIYRAQDRKLLSNADAANHAAADSQAPQLSQFLPAQGARTEGVLVS